MAWNKKRDQQTVPKMGPRISVTALPPPEGAAFASALQRREFGAVRPPAELACAQGAEALLGSLRARARTRYNASLWLALPLCAFGSLSSECGSIARRVAGSCVGLLETEADL
jgi:hypothetical protein